MRHPKQLGESVFREWDAHEGKEGSHDDGTEDMLTMLAEADQTLADGAWDLSHLEEVLALFRASEYNA